MKTFPMNPGLSQIQLLTTSQGCAFNVSTGQVTLAATTETPLLYIANGSTNSASIGSFLRKFVNTTSGHTTYFKHYFNPTVSANGTALSIVNLRNGNGVPTSTMNAYLEPTVSSNGSLLSNIEAGNTQVVSEMPLIIDPGFSLLITATTQAISDVVICELSWFELNF